MNAVKDMSEQGSSHVSTAAPTSAVPADDDPRDSEEYLREGIQTVMVENEGIDCGETEEFEFVAVDSRRLPTGM